MTKRVHTNSMVAHLWAHQSQDSARSNNGNISFDGATLWSYATPIANFVTDKNGERVAFVSSQGYSPTTGQHLSDVRSALGYTTKVAPSFTVPYIGVTGGRSPCSKNDMHTENAAELLSLYTTLLRSAKRSRSLWGGEQERLADAISTVSDYANRFDVSVTLPNLESDWQSVIEYRALRETPEAKAKQEKSWLARIERSRRDFREVRGIYNENWSDHYRYRTYCNNPNSIFTDDDKATRNANLSIINADRVSAWRNGMTHSLRYGQSNILMRVRGNNIETSRGAVFPIEHGKRAFALIKACRDNGKTYQRNGHSIPLGHFVIDSIDMSGNVKAGCHYVEWCEIEHLAREIGLLKRYVATMRVEKGGPRLGKFDSLWAESEDEAREKFLANKTEYHNVKELEIRLADE